MRCHSDVLSWVDVRDGLMYRWVDVKFDHYCLLIFYKKYQRDELQSGPLVVKSLMGRHVGDKSKWLGG